MGLRSVYFLAAIACFYFCSTTASLGNDDDVSRARRQSLQFLETQNSLLTQNSFEVILDYARALLRAGEAREAYSLLWRFAQRVLKYSLQSKLSSAQEIELKKLQEFLKQLRGTYSNFSKFSVPDEWLGSPYYLDEFNLVEYSERLLYASRTGLHLFDRFGRSVASSPVSFSPKRQVMVFEPEVFTVSSSIEGDFSQVLRIWELSGTTFTLKKQWPIVGAQILLPDNGHLFVTLVDVFTDTNGDRVALVSIEPNRCRSESLVRFCLIDLNSGEMVDTGVRGNQVNFSNSRYLGNGFFVVYERGKTDSWDSIYVLDIQAPRKIPLSAGHLGQDVSAVLGAPIHIFPGINQTIGVVGKQGSGWVDLQGRVTQVYPTPKRLKKLKLMASDVEIHTLKTGNIVVKPRFGNPFFFDHSFMAAEQVGASGNAFQRINAEAASIYSNVNTTLFMPQGHLLLQFSDKNDIRSTCLRLLTDNGEGLEDIRMEREGESPPVNKLLHDGAILSVSRGERELQVRTLNWKPF